MEAFVHPSYLVNRDRHKLSSYQRLEFLGDRVVDLIVAEELFTRFTTAGEGELDGYKQLLVNNIRLSEVSRKLGLGEYVLLARGSEHLREDDYVLACVFEALAGSIFIDSQGSYFPVRQILNATLFADLKNVLLRRREFDPKSWLQELSQSKFRQAPDYTVVNQTGDGFVVKVSIGGVIVGQGEGRGKREAEKAAALAALNVTEDLKKVPFRLLRQRDIFKEILGRE